MYDTKLQLMLKPSSWDLGSMEYSFVAITPRSTLALSGNTRYDLIYDNMRDSLALKNFRKYDAFF